MYETDLRLGVQNILKYIFSSAFGKHTPFVKGRFDEHGRISRIDYVCHLC